MGAAVFEEPADRIFVAFLRDRPSRPCWHSSCSALIQDRLDEEGLGEDDS